MWLEATAFLWIPLICAIAGFAGWRLVRLTREVRALSRRVADMEQSRPAASQDRRTAA
jgi:hypothetical protein